MTLGKGFGESRDVIEGCEHSFDLEGRAIHHDILRPQVHRLREAPTWNILTKHPTGKFRFVSGEGEDDGYTCAEVDGANSRRPQEAQTPREGRQGNDLNLEFLQRYLETREGLTTTILEVSFRQSLETNLGDESTT